MYKQNYTKLKSGDIRIRIPNWFLREKGILSRDIILYKNGISIPKLKLNLTVKISRMHKKYIPNRKLSL